MNHRNRLREALEEGGTVLGARTISRAPMFVEVYADLGLDYVWIDFEHGGRSPADARVIEHLARTAEAAGIDLLVRLPSGEPHLIRKVLDAGARTVLIPRVETAGEVRQAVAASRFRYDGAPGERGVATSRASDWGAAGEEYVEHEDATVCVGVMIETMAALGNLDEILGVPALGFVFVGPGDLSVSLGHPLETDHPAVRGAVEDVRNACNEAGVSVGRIANDADDAALALEEGYRFLRIGDEVGPTRRALADRLSALR